MKINYGILLFLTLYFVACKNTENNKKTEPEEISPKKESHSELFNVLKTKDSLLFNIGFNQIDTNQVSRLISDTFEFYHDISGIIDSKKEFIASINSLRELPFITWRILQEESLKVYPLYDHENLYGAIQEGEHDFYQQYEGKSPVKSSTAKFTHVWILESNQWKLRRVLSYNHIDE